MKDNKNIYYGCSCGLLFKVRKNFVRHRMSARKDTRCIKHKFLGKLFWLGK
jgi:hypothetical protein